MKITLTKRGLDFWANEKCGSDVGNYRISTSVKGKDGYEYFLTFSKYEKCRIVSVSKNNVRLKKPVYETCNINALYFSTEYEDDTGKHRNRELETEINNGNYNYTRADILTVINQISAFQYGELEIV